jgi:hypothetical protein
MLIRVQCRVLWFPQIAHKSDLLRSLRLSQRIQQLRPPFLVQIHNWSGLGSLCLSRLVPWDPMCLTMSHSHYQLVWLLLKPQVIQCLSRWHLISKPDFLRHLDLVIWTRVVLQHDSSTTFGSQRGTPMEWRTMLFSPRLESQRLLKRPCPMMSGTPPWMMSTRL